MTRFAFERIQADYVQRWNGMRIHDAKRAAIDSAARRIMGGKALYRKVEAMTGVPWAFIGVLHYRESACDFRGVLHNGEKILGTGRKTGLVPKGRGPFATWEEAACDALALKGFRPGAPAWSIIRCLYEGERFNGFGYRMRGVASAYLWSGSDQYVRGKYVADGKWSATTIDRQLGIAPLMKRLLELDSTLTFDPPVGLAAVNVADGLSSAEIRSVQQRLRDLGYAEVGRVDGIWGPRTIAGISAFQATVGLPVTGVLDGTVAARLATAGPRPVNAARATLSARTLRQEGDVVARTSAATRMLAMSLGVPAALIGIMDQMQAASSRLSDLFMLAGDIPGWVMALAVLAVSVALYLLARQGEMAQIAAVRAGRDAGPG